MADRSITLNLGAKVTGFVNGMRTAQTAASDFVGKGLDKISQNSASITTLSNTAGVMGAGMVAAFGAATKAAIDWETAWAGVTKTVDGSDAQMAVLEDSLREMARTLPATHEEIAAVAEAAGALGVATEDVTGFTETMIALGETTNLTADEAATMTAQISNVMGTMARDGAEGAERFGSALVHLGNNGASTEREILEMASRISSTGSVIGMSEADVLGYANALASVGINAEAGGSAISRVFMDIAESVSTGGEDLGAFAEIAGQSAGDFATAFNEDPARAVATFIQGLGDISAAGGDVFGTLSDLGMSDIRVSQALLTMAESGDLLTQSLDMGAQAWEENTALMNEAEVRYETSASKIQVAWNNIKDAAIEFGAVALPLVADVAGAVATVAQAFGELPDWVKTATMAITGGGGLVLLGVAGMGRLLTSVAGVRDALKTLGLGSAASRMGRLTTSVGKFGIQAGVAAAGAMAIGGGIKFLVDQARGIDRTVTGLEEMINLLQGASESGDYYAATLGRMAEEGQIAAWRFGDLGDAAEAVANQNWGDKLFGKLGIDADGISDATEEFRVMGEALASLPIDQAADQFRGLWIEAGATDEAAQNLLESMPAFEEALYGVANEAGMAASEADILRMATGDLVPVVEEGAGAQDELGAATDATTGSVEEQVEAIADLIEAQADLAGNVLSLREAERNLEQSYDDLTEAIKTNGGTFDITTEKGRANQAALDDIAGSSWDLIEAMAANGASQEQLQGKMQQSRDAFIRAAEGAGISRAAAEALADQLNLIPANVATQVAVNGVDAAISRVQALDSTLNTINGKQVTASVAIQQYGQAAMATGGPVIGPGTGTSDSIPAMLSNGEHVLTAAEVAAAGGHGAIYALRSAIRSGAAKFATGGPVQYLPSFPAPGAGVAAPPTLEGVRIRGRLDLGEGLTGIIDGRILARERQDGAY